MKEGILNNIIFQNFSSRLRVYPNTYFQMDDVLAEAAGGKAYGSFAMNPRNNSWQSVHITIDKAKANAVTRILLNVSNQLLVI